MLKKICIIILLISSHYKLDAQSIVGMSGDYIIPTANLTKDGELNAGVSFFNRKYFEYREFSGKEDAVFYYLNLGYLPFLELGLRITSLAQHPRLVGGVGDRMVNIKIRLFKENEIIPNIVVGLHDILGVLHRDSSTHFNSLFLVLTKNLDKFLFEKVSFTLGFGSSMLKARGHQFVGIFGGVSVKIFSFLEFLSEYDAKRFNLGIKIKFFNRLTFIGGVQNFEAFSGGLILENCLF